MSQHQRLARRSQHRQASHCDKARAWMNLLTVNRLTGHYQVVLNSQSVTGCYSKLTVCPVNWLLTAPSLVLGSSHLHHWLALGRHVRAVTAVVTVCRESCTNEYRIRESHKLATPDSKETCWWGVQGSQLSALHSVHRPCKRHHKASTWHRDLLHGLRRPGRKQPSLLYFIFYV